MPNGTARCDKDGSSGNTTFGRDGTDETLGVIRFSEDNCESQESLEVTVDAYVRLGETAVYKQGMYVGQRQSVNMQVTYLRLFLHLTYWVEHPMSDCPT